MAIFAPLLEPVVVGALGLAAIAGTQIDNAVHGATNPGGGTEASANPGGFFGKLDTLATLLLIGGGIFLFLEAKKALK